MKAILSALVGLALLGAGAQAYGECKSLKKTECVKKTDCQWVKGHKRAGKSVKGYCRAQPGKTSK